MYGCISSAKYTMTMDIYTDIASQDANTNQIKKTWILQLAKVPVYANSIKVEGTRTTESGKAFQDRYDESEMITVATQLHLTKRHRFTNIRTPLGDLVWTEEKTGDPTMYEVVSIDPVISPFGSILEYTIKGRRIKVQ